MVQPYLNMVSTFDASQQKKFTFTYLGAQAATVNQLSIREDAKNSKPIYEQTVTSMDKNHILPSGTLANGTAYLAKIRVKLDEENFTDWSPELKFLCLDTPVLKFATIDTKNFVYNNAVEMQVIYTQKQSEKVTSYQFTLYDQRHVTVQQFPVRIPNTLAPNQFEEVVSNLTKGKLYYISCQISTQNGIVYADEHQFIPQYIIPTFNGIIQPMNTGEEGQITIEAFLKQLLGTPAKPFIPNRPTDADDHYLYWKHDSVIIPKDNPLIFKKLGMAKASDFIFKCWCRNVNNGVMLDWAPSMGRGIHIKFVKHDDYVTIEKEYTGVKSRTKSNTIKGLGKQDFYMYVYVHEFRVQCYLELDPDGSPDNGGVNQ